MGPRWLLLQVATFMASFMRDTIAYNATADASAIAWVVDNYSGYSCARAALRKRQMPHSEDSTALTFDQFTCATVASSTAMGLSAGVRHACSSSISSDVLDIQGMCRPVTRPRNDLSFPLNIASAVTHLALQDVSAL